MKTRLILPLTIVATLAAGPAGAQFQDRSLRLGAATPKDHPMMQGVVTMTQCASSKSGGKLKVQGDMTKLMNNYNNVKMRVNTSDPPSSLLLLKMLAASAGGTSHNGGTYFQNQSNCMYQSWLAWIKLGAPFDSTSTSGAGGQ